MKETEEEMDVVFEPDDALIMALNEINDLRLLVEEQNSAIGKLKEDLVKIKKQKTHGKRLQD